MPHLSELHGAATHLAVVAIPLYVIVLLCRRAEVGGPALAAAEPWVVAAAVAGTLAAGATGLLVWGQAQTELRGGSFRLGTAHFWLGSRSRSSCSWSRAGACCASVRIATRTGTPSSPGACSRWRRCSRRATSAAA